jgi:hypothetical protein
LNDVVRDAGESERSGSARANRMATNTGTESGLQVGYKPGGGGRETGGGEPKLRVEREQGVARGSIAMHKRNQIEGGVSIGKDDNFAALIEAVSLMIWQLKGELVRKEVEGVAGSDLLRGASGGGV